MCVICVKPAGVDLPPEFVMHNMWTNNDDGAGFMWAKDNEVYIAKGFMTYDDFTKAINQLREEEDTKALPMVLHFRIGTHGGNTPGNTHPFPIVSDFETMRRLRMTWPIAIAHNGIIPIATTSTDVSDTMEYVASQLSPLWKGLPDFYLNKNILEMIENAIGSKMAILSGDGVITTIGNFIMDERSGCLFSNSSYSYIGHRSTCSSWIYSTDDDDDDHWLSVLDEAKRVKNLPKRLLMFLPLGCYTVDVDSGACLTSEEYDLAIDNVGRVYWVDISESLDGFLAYRLEGCNGAFDAQGCDVRFNKKSALTMSIDPQIIDYTLLSE